MEVLLLLLQRKLQLPHVTCLHLPQRQLLEKEEYYASILERQAGTVPFLPWSKCVVFSI